MPAPTTSGHIRQQSLYRVTANLTPRSSAALEQVARLTGDNKTDTINRAIQVYAYIVDITQNDGDVYVRSGGAPELERLGFL